MILVDSLLLTSTCVVLAYLHALLMENREQNSRLTPDLDHHKLQRTSPVFTTEVGTKITEFELYSETAQQI